MLNRSLIDVVIDDDGVNYYIGDNGPSIISVMNNEYSKKLIKRCEWVANKFGSYSEDELRNIFFNESIVVGSNESSLNYLGEQLNEVFIKSLIVIGNNKKPAILNFDKKSHLIFGPTDTGKSYIVECIRFCRNEKTPKDVGFSEGYSLAILQIT